MTIYILPASDSALEDRFFRLPAIPYRGGISNNLFWVKFREAARHLGMEMKTYDYWNSASAQKDDILFVQNHPGETLVWRTYYFLKNFRKRGGFVLTKRKFLLENYRKFSRRVLLQAESPMVVPYIYRELDAMSASGLYHKIFLNTRPAGKSYGYFNYFEYRNADFMSPYFREPKKKFLVMINTNARPHGLRNEFYSERLKAIRYFGGQRGFDLYGYGWDKAPRHPFYLHYKKYVEKAWRGEIADKLKALSEYTFSLCFENCSYPGYVSEKIFDCLAVGTIPVYLGAPDVETLVPKNCFIDFRQFRNYDKLHAFLRGMGAGEIARYRNSIGEFLKDTSGAKPITSFVKEIIS